MPLPQSQIASRVQPSPEDWIRVEILPGLEVHLRSDVNLPTSPQEQENLVKAIAKALSTLHQS